MLITFKIIYLVECATENVILSHFRTFSTFYKQLSTILNKSIQFHFNFCRCKLFNQWLIYWWTLEMFFFHLSDNLCLKFNTRIRTKRDLQLIMMCAHRISFIHLFFFRFSLALFTSFSTTDIFLIIPPSVPECNLLKVQTHPSAI